MPGTVTVLSPQGRLCMVNGNAATAKRIPDMFEVEDGINIFETVQRDYRGVVTTDHDDREVDLQPVFVTNII